MKEYTVEVYEDGSKVWRLDGKLHREDGPAIEYADGRKSWWLHSQKLTEEKHRLWTSGITMDGALAAGDAVILRDMAERIKELEAENKHLRAEGAKLNAALNVFFMRDPDKPTCWEYKREKAEALARAALEPVEKVQAKGEE